VSVAGTLWERLARRARNGTVGAITDDGERVTHLFPNDCYVAHLSIYRYVRPLVGGATVLDAGCGAGYGAADLADHGAGEVLGVDASAKAVAFSRRHFARPNLRFEVMRVERLDGLGRAAWDVVVCSNVLEHVADVGTFLRAVAGLLRDAGVLVIAVPPIVSDALRQENLANPYHLNIWSPRQWAHVLGRYFADVAAVQHWYDKPGVELNLRNTPAETVIAEGDFVFRPVAVEALYHLPTISAVFTARRPLAAAHLPRADAALDYVDQSFTRPPSEASRVRRAWRALRALTLRARSARPSAGERGVGDPGGLRPTGARGGAPR
jgi:2-polyprenyl-3-methyl-5-hydroxy-6-metoxy-1,4-benzoquinol methylase